MPEESVDNAFSARYIIPVNTPGKLTQCKILENHTIATKNGLIRCILPTSEFEENYIVLHQHKRFEGNHVIIPGLINCHTHFGMSHLRGIHEDKDLFAWLNKIFPIESELRKEDNREHFVKCGAELGIYEGLMNGTTTFNDMYYHNEYSTSVAKEMGVRYFSGVHVLDFNDPTVETDVENAVKSIQMAKSEDLNDLIRTSAVVHGCYTSKEEHQARVAKAAMESNVIYHTHLHESKSELESFYKNNGSITAIQRLDSVGILNKNLVAAHCVQLTDDEVALLGSRKVNVVHNPKSNMKLGNGACRVRDLLDAGANVCLGTDSTSTNNSQSLLAEAQVAALLAKSSTGNTESLDCYEALQMCTINGAHALGIDSVTGSLEVGKHADIVVVDLHPHGNQIPVICPLADLIYTDYRQVKEVMIKGVWRVEEAKVLHPMDWTKHHKFSEQIKKCDASISGENYF